MDPKIELGFPDIDRVTVHLDGKHVATMWAFEEEQEIPVGLFDLMRAAPDLLASCKLLICYLSDQADSEDNPGLTNACALAVKAINKAEGRSV